MSILAISRQFWKPTFKKSCSNVKLTKDVKSHTAYQSDIFPPKYVATSTDSSPLLPVYSKHIYINISTIKQYVKISSKK